MALGTVRGGFRRGFEVLRVSDRTVAGPGPAAGPRAPTAARACERLSSGGRARTGLPQSLSLLLPGVVQQTGRRASAAGP
eukprot:754945-Hanusia_phi.AAC.3